MLLHTLHLFKHEHCERRRLHEVQAKSRIELLFFLVSKHFSNLKAEECSSTKLGKDVDSLKTLLNLRSGILRPSSLMLKGKGPRNLVCRLGRSTRVERDRPFLNAQTEVG